MLISIIFRKQKTTELCRKLHNMNLETQTLAELVLENHKAVPVLEKYHLDFCCRGKKTLAEACSDKNLSFEEISAELNALGAVNSDAQADQLLSCEELIRKILLKHHFYVKQSGPQITEHIKKVAVKHGDRFPFMRDVFEKFCMLYAELATHMNKEELVLFPRIKEIEKAILEGKASAVSANYILGPIDAMESEHVSAGDLAEEIRVLTNNYTIPEGACTTFRITLAELKEFEEDLHQHVFLENNLLFPKAIAMAKMTEGKSVY